ncbi:CapA family protein, partial [Xanthovirga aplysinae]|uniref:CapA family protein n=1 Tax=Xanthovirga aplysinae TaxID=2529853 RepID=UPI0012BCE228
KEISLALTGDAIITRKLSVYQEPEFLEMIDILRSADMGFTNFEMLLHDYEPYPMHESGGTYMRADPELAKEIKWAGIDMVSTANNHTGDYGVEGMRLTLKYLKEAGLVHAGAGESLLEAREARFFETPNGRVALISCASTFPKHSVAGASMGNTTPRPGLNPLRYDKKYIISKGQMERLTGLGKEMGIIKPRRKTSEKLRFLKENFEVGDDVGLVTTPNQKDLENIKAVVKSASQLADITIVTIHAHERNKDISIPAQFLTTFSREMIDAGADVMVGHGPHVLRGIEIYKGRPIFYSLGDFIFQNETLQRLPYENYVRYGLEDSGQVSDFNKVRYKNDTRGFPARPEVWESVIAYPIWKKGKLKSVKLYPITLGYGKPRQDRGRPMLANRELGEKIIQNLAALSKPFGTKIIWKNGVGSVKLD